MPKNTDGIAIGKSKDVQISDVTISNQDDCVTFKAGADHVRVTNVTCTGSHGMSVGSLGRGPSDTVSNVLVRNIRMIKSTKAAGIKTWAVGKGGLARVTNVTFTDFKVENCEYAIQIQSCYGGDKVCQGNAHLSGVIFENFVGTTTKKFDPATGNLNCGQGTTCDVKVSKYRVKAPSGSRKVMCRNVPKSVDIECTSGASG